MTPPDAPRRLRVTCDLRARAHAQANFGLAEKYLGDIPEAKKVFAFLQSKDYNPLTPDQTKQVTEVRYPAGLSSGGWRVCSVCPFRPLRSRSGSFAFEI